MREGKNIFYFMFFQYNPQKQLSFFMAKRDKNSIHFDLMFFAQWIVIFISFQSHSFPVSSTASQSPIKTTYIKLSSNVFVVFGSYVIQQLL